MQQCQVLEGATSCRCIYFNVYASDLLLLVAPKSENKNEHRNHEKQTRKKDYKDSGNSIGFHPLQSSNHLGQQHVKVLLSSCHSNDHVKGFSYS